MNEFVDFFPEDKIMLFIKISRMRLNNKVCFCDFVAQKKTHKIFRDFLGNNLSSET